MRRRPARGVAVSASVLVAGLAGCVPPPPPVSPPASGTVAIDGTYAGTANGSCGAGPATAVVRDRRFALSMDGEAFLDGVVRADGTLQGAATNGDGRDTNFNGHVNGPDLRGGSYNGRCALAFALRRQS